jgi:hypothetical protein
VPAFLLESVARAGIFTFVAVEIVAMAAFFAFQRVDDVGTCTNSLGQSSSDESARRSSIFFLVAMALQSAFNEVEGGPLVDDLEVESSALSPK